MNVDSTAGHEETLTDNVIEQKSYTENEFTAAKNRASNNGAEQVIRNTQNQDKIEHNTSSKPKSDNDMGTNKDFKQATRSDNDEADNFNREPLLTSISDPNHHENARDAVDGSEPSLKSTIPRDDKVLETNELNPSREAENTETP